MKKTGRKTMAAVLILAVLEAFSVQAGEWLPQDDGSWSYRKDDGTTALGWEQIDGGWYYFLDSGIMATRWIQSEGKWYYMNLDGKMVSDTVIRSHVIGADGAWIERADKSYEKSMELYNVQPSYIWNSVGINRTVTGTDDREYGHSVVIYGDSMAEYDLDGEYTHFSCRLVPRDGFTSGGNMTVVIYGDYDEELYRTEITRNSDVERVDVDITGQHVLGIKCISEDDSESDSVGICWPLIYR